jgi:hypothetical protein
VVNLRSPHLNSTGKTAPLAMQLPRRGHVELEKDRTVDVLQSVTEDLGFFLPRASLFGLKLGMCVRQG